MPNELEKRIIDSKEKYEKSKDLSKEVINRFKSKNKAIELMYKAYETGRFDEIIAHLEVAKEFGGDYIAGIDTVSDKAEVTLFKRDADGVIRVVKQE